MSVNYIDWTGFSSAIPSNRQLNVIDATRTKKREVFREFTAQKRNADQASDAKSDEQCRVRRVGIMTLLGPGSREGERVEEFGS
jgi:hypothetical protein